MSVIASVKDGVIQETASQNSLSKSQQTAQSGMDRDAFLQLLVAQMKYQDPLEPTSNTEYISQYAQFSQVEQMQNMSSSMDLQRASALVGQEVYIKTTTSAGEAKYVQGKVDYVVYENNKAFLSVNNELYSMDDLDTVADKDYMSATEKGAVFLTDFNKLPALENVGLGNEEEIVKLSTSFAEMSAYEQSFISKDVSTALAQYMLKITELKNKEEAGQAGAESEQEAEEAKEL